MVVRTIRAALAALIVFSAGTAAAQIVRDNRQKDENAPVVRDHRSGQAFTVRAYRLHADNETGIDRVGSDEIVAVFTDRRTGGPRRTTSVFSNFDTGETRGFHASENCIAPIAGAAPEPIPARAPRQWDCRRNGAAAPIAFEVALFEVDDWHGAACGAAAFIPFDDAGCGADLVGRATITLSAAKLSTVRSGGTFETVRLGGYTLTYVIQRLDRPRAQLRRRAEPHAPRLDSSRYFPEGIV
jgi:hypothetical protein